MSRDAPKLTEEGALVVRRIDRHEIVEAPAETDISLAALIRTDENAVMLVGDELWFGTDKDVRYELGAWDPYRLTFHLRRKAPAHQEGVKQG